jgi:hypothetical protein
MKRIAGQSVIGYGPDRKCPKAVNNRPLKGTGCQHNREDGSDESGGKTPPLRSALWLKDLII